MHPNRHQSPGAQHLIAAAGTGALVGAGAAWQAGLDTPVQALLLAAAAALVIGVALALLVRSERSRTWLAQSKAVT